MLQPGASVDRVKSLYGDVPYVGLGDGAKDNWTFLMQHTDQQVLDFWHASEYVSNVASVLFKGNVSSDTFVNGMSAISLSSRPAAQRLGKELAFRGIAASYCCSRVVMVS